MRNGWRTGGTDEPDERVRRRAGRGHHRGPGSAGSRTLALLIAAALGISGLLAYQAHDAARSHQEVARQTVSDVASAAAWQVGERGSMAFSELVRETVARHVHMSGSPRGELPSLEAFVRTAGNWDQCSCFEVKRPATFFRMGLDADGPSGAGKVEVHGGPLEPAVRHWLADTLRTVAGRSSALASPDEEAGEQPPGGLLIREVGDEVRAYAYYVRFVEGPGGAVPGAVYGYESSAGSLLEAALPHIFERKRLLPESLTGGLPSDSLFLVEIGAPNGTTLFTSQGPSHLERAVTGEDDFPSWAGGMEIRIFVPEDRAEALVIGGLPASRLPLIALLLALTGGVLIAAVLLLRKEQDLARSRSDFVAGVTHELRTPLAQIRLFTDLLSLEKLPDEKERRRALSIIDEESRRLDHLIDNVLGFARIGVSGQALSTAPLPMDEILPDVVERFQPLARERRVTFQLDVQEGLFARGHRDGVRRAVLNLLDNAVKYGPRGQCVRISAREAGRWIRVQVDDEGPGVPLEDRARIWDPYERATGGDGTDPPGSGIGLSVVKGLVEAMDGRVSVEDVPGGGGRFVILLHRVEKGATSQEPGRPSSSPTQDPVPPGGESSPYTAAPTPAGSPAGAGSGDPSAR